MNNTPEPVEGDEAHNQQPNHGDQQPVDQAEETPKTKKSPLIPIVAAVAGVAIIGGGIAIYQNSQKGFAAVQEACENSVNEWVMMELFLLGNTSLSDDMQAALKSDAEGSTPEFISVNGDGSGMTVSRQPSVLEDSLESKGYDFDEREIGREADKVVGGTRDMMLMGVVGCINEKLAFREVVADRMEQTRSLDGTQTGTYGGVTVSWSYHPDSGMQVLYERA